MIGARHGEPVFNIEIVLSILKLLRQRTSTMRGISLLCKWSYSEVPIMSCGKSSKMPLTRSSQSMMRPFGVSRTTNS